MLVLQSGWVSSVGVGGGGGGGGMRTKQQRPLIRHDVVGMNMMIGSFGFGHPRSNSSASTSFCCFSTLCSSSNVEIVEMIHNKVKVLIAAAVSAAIGQFSKPFTSTILYGDGNLNFKNAFQAGGFPSTHSSAAVATATALGLERGLSDSIFGLAVVYACLIMYDAQGVRREVGSHAKALNKVLFRNNLDTNSTADANTEPCSTGESSSSNLETKRSNPFQPAPAVLQKASLLLKPDTRTQSASLETLASGVKGEISRSSSIPSPFGCKPLKESVGHTEIEVIAGAMLGFFVSLAVCSTI